MTQRQQQVLDYVRNTIAARGIPPTRKEIAQAFGFASPNAAEELLKRLAKQGEITLIPLVSRGIRLRAA